MTPLHVAYTAPSDNIQSIIESAQALAKRFSYECGLSPRPLMVREFARYLAQGYDYDMLAEVINRTAMAPRPSYAYFAAIMRNAYGCKTLHDFVCLRSSPSTDPSFDDALDLMDIAEIESMLRMASPPAPSSDR